MTDKIAVDEKILNTCDEIFNEAEKFNDPTVCKVKIDKTELECLQEIEQDYQGLEEMFNKLNEFNESLVKFIQQKGVITKQEYERLNRLDENVKLAIEREKLSCDEIYAEYTHKEVIKLLEGLDK